MTFSLTAGLVFLISGTSINAQSSKTANSIRTEATRKNFGEEGRPLPLAASWTCGHFQQDRSAGWRPENQMRLIEKGHHLLPWFSHPSTKDEVPDDPNNFWIRYYKAPIDRARELKLPLTFIASQWESALSRQPYVDLPADKNPNVVTTEGRIETKVSPFGPVGPWKELGATFTDNPWMKAIQSWYPDPPLVIFLSNNEHHKLRWKDVETSKRYIEQHGEGRDDDFKRKAVADGWVERYRALQSGIREGLTSDSWKKNALFVGYGVGDLAHLGRWGGWKAYSLCSPGRIDPGAFMWDGGSPSYYTHDWNSSRDDTAWSPQLEFMNNLSVLNETHRINPNYFFEFSVWDGYHTDKERQKKYPSTRSVYRKEGQTYDPERYGGFVQFGMWLMRPRAVRDFRGWIEPWDDMVDKDGNITWEGGGPYFLAIAKAVDRVHVNPVLCNWWRRGKLVPNRAHRHPYQTAIPDEWKDVDRWYLLDCDANSSEYPWKLQEPVHVFSLALVQGEKPNRRWLLYAHSPRGDRKQARVTIPDYKEIAVSTSTGGNFYEVTEDKDGITPVVSD
ncbi:MAG: hypothetical protein O3B01_09595 [Planctomycetota bacterium]|nr:hypothetical protein [Planctomycetota bacterium]